MIYQSAYRIEAGTDTVHETGMTYFGATADLPDTLVLDYQQDINKIEILGQSYPNLSVGNSPLEKLVATFSPVDISPFYLALGKLSGNIATNYTITEGEKPHFKIWKRMDDTVHVGYDCKCSRLTWKWNINQSVMELEGMGGYHFETGYVNCTPTLSENGTKVYKLPEYLKWNDVQLINPTELNTEITTKMNGIMHPSGYYGEIDEQGATITTFTLQYQGYVTGLESDCNNGTSRTFTFKCKNTEGDYVIVTAENAYCVYSKPMTRTGEPVFHTAVIAASNVTVQEG